ncbi:hypothetical protein GH714_000575 [Hevea brasiliensis]|uniref:Uncharacterized protein n=1 Tax=Hevea brasiliensis TaxID=3981 RepID=A0A6A6NAK6_HEVBR|nr:hypothetical protein GH714_000575 [Hevea brasiliensis]
MAKRGVDDIGLDLEIDGYEISRISVVSMDAANFGSSQDKKFRLFSGKEGLDWRVRSSSAWVRRTRLVKPRAWNLRTIVDPTRPRWPATKILEDLLERKDDESREKDDNINHKIMKG